MRAPLRKVGDAEADTIVVARICAAVGVLAGAALGAALATGWLRQSEFHSDIIYEKKGGFFFALPVVRPVTIFALHGGGIAIDDGAKYGEEGSAACVALYASSSHYARCLANLKLLSHSQSLVSFSKNF